MINTLIFPVFFETFFETFVLSWIKRTPDSIFLL